jgi:hypothetical protein
MSEEVNYEVKNEPEPTLVMFVPLTDAKVIGAKAFLSAANALVYYTDPEIDDNQILDLFKEALEGI